MHCCVAPPRWRELWSAFRALFICDILSFYSSFGARGVSTGWFWRGNSKIGYSAAYRTLGRGSLAAHCWNQGVTGVVAIGLTSRVCLVHLPDEADQQNTKISTKNWCYYDLNLISFSWSGYWAGQPGQPRRLSPYSTDSSWKAAISR